MIIIGFAKQKPTSLFCFDPSLISAGPIWAWFRAYK